MDIPIYSTITLFTEVIVSIAIGYIFYSGYKKNKFPYKIAFAALSYEVLFNVSYMVYRVLTHSEAKPEPAFDIILAIFHGTLSLIMFISLVIFLLFAWKNYRKGKNYFRQHKRLTFVFLFFWFLSVFSGILFYFVEYFGLFS